MFTQQKCAGNHTVASTEQQNAKHTPNTHNAKCSQMQMCGNHAAVPMGFNIRTSFHKKKKKNEDRYMCSWRMQRKEYGHSMTRTKTP